MSGVAELRIVNTMLALVGEGTQASLETTHPSVIQMRALLDNEDFELQSIGWWFNRESKVTLVKDVNGRVTVPSTALAFSIDATTLQYKTAAEKARYVRRGTKVYDTIEHTDIINVNIVCDLVYRLELDDLPPVAQTYLGCLAREKANMSDDGDMSKQKVLEDQTLLAWGRLYAKELSTLAANALDSPQAQQLQYRGNGGRGRNPNLIGG
jgi:hypothetical protein